MKKLIIPVFIIVFFLGCNKMDPRFNSGPVPHNTKMMSVNNTLSLNIPNSYPKTLWNAWSDFRKNRITLDRTIPNMMREDIDIRIRPLSQERISKGLLNKKYIDVLNEHLHNLPLTPWEIKNNKERRITYFQRYADYIAGLKCGTKVESRNITANIGSRDYQTTCDYYDKKGNPQRLHSHYILTFTFNQTLFEGSHSPSLVQHHLEEIQLQFKQDMKEIFDSMILYDMDTERMKKEGLLFDEKYQIQHW